MTIFTIIILVCLVIVTVLLLSTFKQNDKLRKTLAEAKYRITCCEKGEEWYKNRIDDLTGKYKEALERNKAQCEKNLELTKSSARILKRDQLYLNAVSYMNQTLMKQFNDAIIISDDYERELECHRIIDTCLTKVKKFMSEAKKIK